MIEIQNINPVNKGSILATCSVKIVPWKITFHDIKIFEKGASRWIGMPSKEKTNASGEKTYTDLVTFDCEAAKNRFRAQIMDAVDKYLQGNPELKPEDVIKEDDLPF